MKLLNFKKTASLLIAGLMTFGLCACSAANTGATVNPDGKKLSIVTTVFPEYDWVKQIAGANISNIELTMLLDNGADMHSFQPTAQDIVKISSCDIFIYVGGESDDWVEDALAEAVNQDMQVVNLMELLGGLAVEEEVIEGMQAEDGEDESEAEPEYDEHVWLSLRNAQIFVTGIADAMSKADPDNMDRYQTNADTYCKALAELDSKYKEAVTNAARDTILFGDRFPFRYLLDDYNINYYAAFAGCSAETEASFETIVFLSGKMDELGLKYIVVTEGSDSSIAQTIIDNTSAGGQEILVMDSMQSTKTTDGVTYVTVMSDNLEVFNKALG